MNKKEIYVALCQKEKTIPLFFQTWWLDAVYENHWDVLLVGEDSIRAAIPFQITRSMGFKTLVPMPLTPFASCWINYPQNQSPYEKMQFEKEVMTDLATQIDALKVDFFLHYFPTEIQNWQPFYWKNFKQTTRYTYQVENLQQLLLVFQSFHPRVCQYIRSAERKVTIEEITAEEVFDLSLPTYKRQNMPIPYSKAYLNRMYAAAKQHNAVRAIVAKDKDQKPMAIHLMLWDQRNAYGVVFGRLDDCLLGANHLVLWEQMQFASKLGLNTFDFQGSMMENVALFNSRMGGIQKPYFCLQKPYSKLYNCLRNLRQSLR